jgi:hypothetical protein
MEVSQMTVMTWYCFFCINWIQACSYLFVLILMVPITIDTRPSARDLGPSPTRRPKCSLPSHTQFLSHCVFTFYSLPIHCPLTACHLLLILIVPLQWIQGHQPAGSLSVDGDPALLRPPDRRNFCIAVSVVLTVQDCANAYIPSCIHP